MKGVTIMMVESLCVNIVAYWAKTIFDECRIWIFSCIPGNFFTKMASLCAWENFKPSTIYFLCRVNHHYNPCSWVAENSVVAVVTYWLRCCRPSTGPQEPVSPESLGSLWHTPPLSLRPPRWCRKSSLDLSPHLHTQTLVSIYNEKTLIEIILL